MLISRQCWLSFRQSTAFLGQGLLWSALFWVLPSFANSNSCEQSHLVLQTEVRTDDLVRIANNLAHWRLSIQKMKSSEGSKRLASEEFAQKFREFELIVGSKERALQLLQEQIQATAQEAQKAQQQEQEFEKKMEEQRRDELENLEPINMTRRMQFYTIQPGEFRMGPERKVLVKISEAFEMMNTPVTQMTWSRIQVLLGEKDPKKINPSAHRTRRTAQGLEPGIYKLGDQDIEMQADNPVENLTYNQVKIWVQGLNQLSNSDDPRVQKILSRIFIGHQKGMIYDWPSEAEWEFVMTNRGQNYETNFDREDKLELADYAHYGFGTIAVGTLKPRMIDGQPFYDLEGNVSEWMKDLTDGKLQWATDPLPLKGPYAVIRGGRLDCWTTCKSSINFRELVSTKDKLDRGFRLTRRPAPQAAPVQKEKISIWKKLFGSLN